MALQPTRRVVTGHDSNGKAIFISDSTLNPANPLAADGSAPPPMLPGFTMIGKTKGFPDTTVGDEEFTDHHGKRMPLSDDSGVTCRVVDFPPMPPNAPDEVNFMHRTQSYDFGVVLIGRIICALDSGEEREVGVGDIVVQRGTMHAWRNTFSEPCKMMFILVPSVPVKAKSTGEVLEATDTTHLTTKEGAKKVIEEMMAKMKLAQQGQ